ncbi:sortase [Candidatus Dojkabacteria bacterium]|nr:sortase [Candidatus Dojkabacteria bacterium]
MSEIETISQRLSKMNLKRRPIKIIGGLLLLLGFAIIFLTYKDYLSAYITYTFSPKVSKNVIVKVEQEVVKEEEVQKEKDPVIIDSNFGIYIPKIGANSVVIPNVNAYAEREYTSALTKGVAHAKGTALPNEKGNTFLFAHSAVNFYEQRKYNVYFYLINKLEKGDEIYLSYKGTVYKYSVREVKIFSPTDVKYLGKYKDRDTVTLMTCWPAGFNFKRVIVVGDKVE